MISVDDQNEAAKRTVFYPPDFWMKRSRIRNPASLLSPSPTCFKIVHVPKNVSGADSPAPTQPLPSRGCPLVYSWRPGWTQTNLNQQLAQTPFMWPHQIHPSPATTTTGVSSSHGRNPSFTRGNVTMPLRGLFGFLRIIHSLSCRYTVFPFTHSFNLFN